MRRYLQRMLFSLIVLLLLTTKFVDLTVGGGFGRHPIEVAWSASGLAAGRFTLDYWAICHNEEPRTDPGRIARRIGARLGVIKPRVFTGRAAGVAFANLDGTLAEEGDLFLTVQSDASTTNIGLSCYYTRLPKDLQGLIGRIRRSTPDPAAQGSFYWTIEGCKEGRLDAAAWRGMWVRVLNSVSAARRGDRPGDNVIEAYTPLLPTLSGDASGRINLVLTLQHRGEISLVRLSSPELNQEI